MDLFPIDWRAKDASAGSSDEDPGEFLVECFGKTPDGVSRVVEISFPPYFFVAMPSNWSSAKINFFISECVRKYRALPHLSVPLKRKTLYGFTNNEQRPFAQLAFKTLADFKKARYGLARERMQTYEASLDPLLRLFHVRDIQPASWLKVEGVDPNDRIWKVDFRSISASECKERPPLILASWDIEAISATAKFPNADIPGDKIITIGVAYQRYGDPEPYKRTVVTLDTCDDIEGVHVIACDSEADVIDAWIHDMRKEDVDVLLGYNTYQFDFRYVYGRALQCVDEYGESTLSLKGLGKRDDGGDPVEKNLSSAAFGDNKFFVLTTPGTANIDLLQIFRRELKLDSYSLKNVSLKYLDGLSKLDLLPGEIFEKFKGNAADRATIAEYCIRDVELPLKLMSKLHTLENLLEMSNACAVPVEYLLTRGQQIKVFSLLVKKARGLGFVAPDVERNSSVGTEKYEGATVLEAKKGGYFEVISALDFASLYPSIMRAHNICPSTLVLDDEAYGNLEGLEYYTVTTTDGTTHKFAQKVSSVVPPLLEELALFRKQAKREMAVAKHAGDEFAAALYDAKQLAYKVSMNSVYGFFGAVRGILPCVPVASSVTATGRLMIMKSKHMAETLVPGTEVIYGDSVAGYTPCIVKVDDRVCVTTFEHLGDMYGGSAWAPMHNGKESCELPGVYVWSDEGWTAVARIIRHRAGKDMVRVVTHTGVVDVTVDHSLLTERGTPVSPRDVAVGHSLMHANLPSLDRRADAKTYSVAEARVRGFFFGDGSAGCYDCPSGKKASWALNNSDLKMLEKYKALCEVAHPEYSWVIMPTMESSHVYKLAPRGGGGYGMVKALVQEYRESMYAGASKVIPMDILAADAAVRRAFWDGMYDADGEKGIGYGTIDQKSHLSAAHIFILADSLGFKVSVNDRDTKPDVFRISVASRLAKDPVAIKKVRPIQHQEDAYVYDLTTSNNHFSAGIGRLVVHNTDSILCKFKIPDPDRQDDMTAHFEVAQRVAEQITATFDHPVELEFEKCYKPYLLFTKKRYAGLLYTKPDAPDYVDVKGLQLVRRDSAPIVKTVSSKILDVVMYKQSIRGAVDEARNMVASVLRGDLPLDQFIVSKQLKGSYANPNAQPHVIVAKKILQRRGYPIVQGERVPYVFVVDKTNADGLQSSRAEDPEYVKEHGLQIDLLYYLKNQMMNPITTLLEVLVDDVEASVLGHADIQKTLRELETDRKKDITVSKRIKLNAGRKQHEITSFFSLKR